MKIKASHLAANATIPAHLCSARVVHLQAIRPARHSSARVPAFPQIPASGTALTSRILFNVFAQLAINFVKHAMVVRKLTALLARMVTSSNLLIKHAKVNKLKLFPLDCVTLT